METTEGKKDKFMAIIAAKLASAVKTAREVEEGKKDNVMAIIAPVPENPRWYAPYEANECVFYKEEGLKYVHITNGFKTWAAVEMIISDDTLGNGGNNVTVVFRPHMPWKITEMTRDEWIEKRWLGVHAKNSFGCYFRDVPSIFETVENNLLSKTRVALKLTNPNLLFYLASKDLIKIWAEKSPPEIAQELKVYIHERNRMPDTTHRPYASLNPETVAWCYQLSLEIVGEYIRWQDGNIAITENKHSFKHQSLENFAAAHKACLAWGRRDMLRLKHVYI